ncbi:MAG: DUF2474 domain-containing protein [Janthinobacterium lividum]
MATRREWMRRIGWMAALWAGGVTTLALVAYLIRLLMRAFGMQ